MAILTTPAPTIMLTITLTITFALCAAPSSALEWSEVMFNPFGNDNGREYVELAGAEPLSGCTIADASSQDVIALNRTGSSTILILESDHLFGDAELGNATLYTIGAAIGNGLGNTADSITISCDDKTVITMSYNTSLIEGYAEGHSLVFNRTSGGWELGQMNGTPGILDTVVPHNVTGAADTANGTGNGTGPGGDEDSGIPPPCDDTLLIALNATKASPGDRVLMGIISAGYAYYDITADGLPFESGDTLTTHNRTLLIPQAKELKIVANMEECGSRQRAVRYLDITSNAAPDSPADTTANASATNITRTNRSKDAERERPAPAATPIADASAAMPAIASSPPAQRPRTGLTAQAAQPQQAAPLQQARQQDPGPAEPQASPLTGMAVVDQDANAIPWIAAFGIVTVAASTAVFLQLMRRGQA